MDASQLLQIPSKPIEKVIIHPLVLLSVVDNYNRVSQKSFRRVVGVLLGSSFKGTVNVSNSYAVPFEEDDTDPSICFLDHLYVEAMFSMFKKINAKEHVVGWYSTGPNLRVNDLDIHRLFHKYVPNPILVIINVRCWGHAIPTEAYYDIEEVKEENAATKSQKIFVPVPSEIVADEVEEIVVEKLLRDVKDTAISTLAKEVSEILTGLEGLNSKMGEMHWYCCRVIRGWCPSSHDALYHLQDVFNCLPNLNDSEFIKAFTVQINDMLLIMYLCSLIRCVIALHNLINNKIVYKEHEDAEDAKEMVWQLIIDLIERGELFLDWY